ncbi:hypothetical protein T4C_1773 [Trichinella pseudospiralis]|uniref:Uncharacterized protein n=1 Tax=Trichinella pseudospiralis TaxID=6337 RepID=A0A0V1GEY1_TRIPS|nr:hypothetical protein T4C_1773 [Trichinella pseudospiralis]
MRRRQREREQEREVREAWATAYVTTDHASLVGAVGGGTLGRS